jgi:hypothetical protein
MVEWPSAIVDKEKQRQEEDQQSEKEMSNDVCNKNRMKMTMMIISAVPFKKSQQLEKRLAANHIMKKRINLNPMLLKKLNNRKKELEIIVNAMAEAQYRANEIIIKQGEEGNELFVVESGTQKCSIKKVFTDIEANR